MIFPHIPLQLLFLVGFLVGFLLFAVCLWCALELLGRLVSHIHLTLDPQSFSLRWKLFGLPSRRVRARTTEIKEIRLGNKQHFLGVWIETCDIVVNTRIHSFGQKLSDREKTWLAAELSGFLNQLRSRR